MTPSSPIEIEFQLQLADVFLARLERGLWNRYLVIWTPVLLFTGYLLIVPHMGVTQINGQTIDPVTASIPWVLFLFVYPAFIYFTSHSFLKTNKATQGKLRYIFSVNGVELIGEGTSSQFSWSNVHKVIETRSALLLYLSSAGFLIVPKRSYGDTVSVDSLRALIRSRVSGKVKIHPK